MKTLWLNLRPALGWLAVATILVIPVLTLSGAVDMFLKLGGIEGESQDKVHAKEIDVLAWSWGMSNSGTTHGGGGGAREKPGWKHLSIPNCTYNSTPAIRLAALTGEHIPEALLTVRKAGSTPVEYIKLEMKEIIVSSVSTGGSGGEDRLTENITLNFANFKLTYTPQKADGSADTLNKKEVTWNIAENTGG